MMLKRKIYLTTLITITLVLVGICYILIDQMYSAVRASELSTLEAVANIQKSRVNDFIDNNYENIDIIASRTYLKKYLEEYDKNPSASLSKEILTLIQDTQKGNEEFIEIAIFDANDKLVASTQEETEEEDVMADMNMNEKRHLHFDKEGGESYIFVHGQIVNDQGAKLGTVVVEESAKALDYLTSDYTGLGKTGETQLAEIGEEGNIEFLYSPRFEYEESHDTLTGEESARAMAYALKGIENSYEDTIDYRNEKVISVTKYIPGVNWGMVVKQDRSEVYRPIYIAEAAILVMSVIMWVAIFFILRWIIKIIFEPIKNIQDGMAVVQEGDLNFRLNNPKKDELASLANSFDSMTASLQKSRAEVDLKVKDQTKDILEKSKKLEDQQSAVLNILEDIEEEKEKVESIATDLEKFKLAVDNASDHIVITDLDGILVYANKAVEKITGFSNSEVMGKKAGSKELWGGQMPIEVYQNFWNTIKKNKKSFYGLFNNKRKNGAVYEAEAHVAPVLDENGDLRYFVGIERDVTKEKEVDRAKTEFVSLASHQLRTPLSAINWYTEMLINGDAGKVNEEQASYLDEIYKGNQRMVDLVNSLLNVSRLELGTFEIKPEPVDLKEMAKDVVNEMQPQINLKSQKITQEYSPRLPKANVDKRLTRIIFQNLLSNAVKYTPNKGSIGVSVSYGTKGYKITVSDTGYGVPKEQQDKLFTKLFRADNVRSMDTEGTGLGLYIIKSIVDSAGGRISFKSALNKGTTFVIELPKGGMKEKEGSKSLD